MLTKQLWRRVEYEKAESSVTASITADRTVPTVQHAPPFLPIASRHRMQPSPTVSNPDQRQRGQTEPTSTIGTG